MYTSTAEEWYCSGKMPKNKKQTSVGIIKALEKLILLTGNRRCNVVKHARTVIAGLE